MPKEIEIIMQTNCKIIYSKRVKELLEDEYKIYSIGRCNSPYDNSYKAWIFKRTDALLLAIDKIMNAKGDNVNGTNSKDT